MLARQGILTNGVGPRKSPQNKNVKKLKLQSKLDSEDSDIYSDEENEKEIFRVGIEIEQETLEEIQDLPMSREEAEDAEMSLQQKLIKEIMGDSEMNNDSDIDDIENQITNSNHVQPLKDKSAARGTGKILKKRSRVIMDSDSD